MTLEEGATPSPATPSPYSNTIGPGCITVVHLLPLLGQLGAPYFNSNNAIEFL